MITFNRHSSDNKKLTIFKNDEEVITLTQLPSTITNRYEIIESMITDMSKLLGDSFDCWLSNFLTIYEVIGEDVGKLFQEDDEFDDNIDTDLLLESDEYIDQLLDKKLTRYDIALSNVDDLVFFVDEYFEMRDFNFKKFVDTNKASKTSIFFDEVEVKEIMIFSSYLKIYSLIFNSSIRLNSKLHKKIYNKLLDKAISKNSTVITKLLEVIQTKTFRYNLTDRYMWEYIKMVQCKDIDDHVLEIFNFIMTNILILCEFDKNPITYFVSVTNESIKWFLRSVYKGSIVYENTISAEDVHTSTINNLYVYSYNDTLGRLKEISSNKVYDHIEKNSPVCFNDGNPDDLLVTQFQTRMCNIKWTPPVCEILTFPIISTATEIPYKYVKSIAANPDDSTIMSIYIYFILNKVFKGEYDDFFKLLTYFPLEKPADHTTYEIKEAILYINNMENKKFYKFETKILLAKILSNFIGKCSRLLQENALTGGKVVGIPLSKIEKDMIYFYSNYFSGQLDDKIKKVSELIMEDF